MDPFSAALGALKFGIETINMARRAGMLGGSVDFLDYIPDIDTLYGNFLAFVNVIKNKAEYDRINEMTDEEKRIEVYSRILLEGMEAKNNRLRKYMGLGEPLSE